MALKLNENYLKGYIGPDEIKGMEPMVKACHDQIVNKSGLGNDFLGWVDLPVNYDKEEFARIKEAAKKIRADSDVLLVIGIGGSYLGARATIELLKSTLYNSLCKDTPQIYFVGNSISPTYLNEIIEIVKDKDFSVNIISKSGTTTEPALAFRVFREMLEERYGEEGAKNRIYATTDKAKGTLKELSDAKGYQTFVIPDDIGGRFSVLTPVGLLPIACAGCDIDALMAGAAKAREDYSECDLEKNDCYRYAAIRNILFNKDFKVEMLCAYENSFLMMCEWFKQLFGESEGKNRMGLFPTAATFSTDLHSLGQFIQEGSNIIFETVVHIKKAQKDFFLKNEATNGDGLNFLSNQNMSVVNEKAYLGTVIAHTEGGTPNVVIEMPEINEEEVGYFIYFFEKACAMSGYLLGVNPFNQPGVESYKKNMFALLGKPGYEDAKAELEAKIG